MEDRLQSKMTVVCKITSQHLFLSNAIGLSKVSISCINIATEIKINIVTYWGNYKGKKLNICAYVYTRAEKILSIFTIFTFGFIAYSSN